VWCHLIADADERISWDSALSAIVSRDLDSSLVEEIQECFWSLVSRNGGELPWDDAVFLFKNAPLVYEKACTLSDAAIASCIRADPRLVIEGDRVRCQSAGRGQPPNGSDSNAVARKETVVQAIVAVFAEYGPELAVSDIIMRVKARRPTAEATIRTTLAHDRRFVRVGPGTYALVDSVNHLE